MRAASAAPQTLGAHTTSLDPANTRCLQAYLPDERHGPIFKLLNKRLFGHAIDSFRPVFRAPPPAGAGAAGAAADCT